MAMVRLTAIAAPVDIPSGYNIVWDSPSTNATGSMPLSGGNLGLNVWIEPPSPDGYGAPRGDDLLFYIGHPDSRVEDGKLVKLGRVRLSLSSNPLRKNFRQELDLQQSCIRISGEGTAITLWADAFDPVVHVEMQSDAPVTASVAYESWRFQARPITNGLEWCYRLDPAKDQRAAKLKQQRVEAIADVIPSPLTNLTLGGRIVGDGLIADGMGEGTYMRTPFKSWKAKTEKPVTRLDLRVLLRVAQDDSVEAWRHELDRLQAARSDRQKTLAWWREFWDRSWIVIQPTSDHRSPVTDPAWQVGRNYQLFRYMLAANRTGRFPTLFNGGIHTFDNPLPNANAFGAGGPDPDERAWWGCHFMAQNQRLVYWPMLKAGDIDMLDVGLSFYRDRAPVAQAKAKHFFGVEGTLFTESLDVFGLIAACPSGNGLEAATHLTHHFTSGLEFAFMMLEECRFTGRSIESSLPVIMGMLKFYDNLYRQECLKRTGKPLDEKGKLVIFPGNSCEMGVGCRNHADAVAGLRAIAAGLLAFPGTDRAWLEAFRKRIPELPVEEKGGCRTIKLAESWQSISNPNEFPQMYTVFPFHLYGVGLPDLELALNTWRGGNACQKEALCWKYGNIAAADLGLAFEAQQYCLKKFLYPYGKDGGTAHYGNCGQFTARFPAFWVTYSFDAFPDMDHGGCAMIGLQEMLLQTPSSSIGSSGATSGDRLLLLPAWPQDWDVHFKLHAPKRTTVECEVKGGKIVRLVVTPESRRKDVEIAGPIAPPPTPVSQGKPAAASSVDHAPGYEPDKAFDGDLATRWSMDNGQGSGWLEVDLGKPAAVARAVIQEQSYPQTTRFAVEAQAADGSWKTLTEGAAIGMHKEVKFPPTIARKFRLHILESKLINAGAGVTVDEFQLFQ
jgi:hypothetical protein